MPKPPKNEWWHQPGPISGGDKIQMPIFGVEIMPGSSGMTLIDVARQLIHAIEGTAVSPDVLHWANELHKKIQEAEHLATQAQQLPNKDPLDVAWKTLTELQKKSPFVTSQLLKEKAEEAEKKQQAEVSELINEKIKTASYHMKKLLTEQIFKPSPLYQALTDEPVVPGAVPPLHQSNASDEESDGGPEPDFPEASDGPSEGKDPDECPF